MKLLILAILLISFEGIIPTYSQDLIVSVKQRNRPGQGSAQPAEKPCQKDGVSYPSGTVLGDKLCSNGEWINIPPP